MILDMRIVPEGRSSIEQYSALEAYRDELPPFTDPVRCRAEVDRQGGTVIADVRFDGVFSMQCVRCLEDYSEPVSGSLRVIIKEEAGKHGAAKDFVGADFFFDVNHDLVDISPAIYDEIMTELSMKPLCSEDCEGIKLESADDSVPGGDNDFIDPRWAALKKLQGL